MRHVCISDTTYQMIAAAAQNEFKAEGTQSNDGSWVVPLEDNTFERILVASFPMETLDDTIQRIITTQQ